MIIMSNSKMKPAAAAKPKKPIWLQTLEKMDLMGKTEEVVGIFKADGMKTTKLDDLPLDLTLLCSPGEIATGILTYVRSPSQFYMVVQKFPYEFQKNQDEWAIVFPAFLTVRAAFRGIHALLTIFYKLAPLTGFDPEKFSFQPEVDDLVCVKVIRHNQTKKNVFSTGKPPHVQFQMRRGLVRRLLDPDPNSDQHLYLVYMLDYGFELVVSSNFLFPLPKPFHAIIPLATKCALYGVSPCGENWDLNSSRYFRNTLIQHRESVVSMQFCSPMESFRIGNLPSIVNLQVHSIHPNTNRLTLQFNFTEELIKQDYGIPWVITPPRPKLMEGTKVPPDHPKFGYIPPSRRFTVSLQNTVLLCNPLPTYYNLFPISAFKRDMMRLYKIRKFHIVHGIPYQLLLVVKDRPHLKKPAVIALRWKKEEEVAKDKEDLATSL